MFAKKFQALLFAALLLIAPLAPAQSKRVAFELRSLDNETVTSQGARGQVVVLAFGASWLPLSRKQMEGLRTFAAKNTGQGVMVY